MADGIAGKHVSGSWRYPEAPGAMGGGGPAGNGAGADHGAGFGAAFDPARPRPMALLLVVALHALALTLLLTQKMWVPVAPAPEPMLVVEVPPPLLSPPPVTDMPELRLEIPAIVVPPPLVEIEREQRPAVVARLAEPAPAVVRQSASPAPAAASSGPAPQSLPATMIEAPPPRYPLEARQRKEQGTVVLDVQLSTDGRVERIDLFQSSGSPRLDKAALDAVRRWRWSPMLQNGVAVAVRGLVEIPFILTGR